MFRRIEADYLIETSFDPRYAAEVMAGEQSTGTFVKIPGESLSLKKKFGACVEKLTTIGILTKPSLPGAFKKSAKITQAHVTLSWPLGNIGASLPNLITTVAGNLFELQQFSGLRILDIRFPNAFAKKYVGPQFGVQGTRKIIQIKNQPMIGTIIKPSIGLTATQTANLVKTLAEAGIDFIKDDELQVDSSNCSFKERVIKVMQVLKKHFEQTGKKIMFAFNITGSIEEMRERHDLVVKHEGNCLMISLNSIGMSGVLAVRKFSVLPIHAHRNGWGYLTRCPSLGWSYIAWQKLWRVAGVDHLHVNGLQNKFCEDDDSVISSAQECLKPLFSHKQFKVMPVFSSGQSIIQIPETFKRLGSVDLIYAAGGGIMGHPQGVKAGVVAINQAWKAAIQGISLVDFAKSHEELSIALKNTLKNDSG